MISSCVLAADTTPWHPRLDATCFIINIPLDKLPHQAVRVRKASVSP